MKLVIRENEHGMEEKNEKPFKKDGTRGEGRTHNLWLRRLKDVCDGQILWSSFDQ